MRSYKSKQHPRNWGFLNVKGRTTSFWGLGNLTTSKCGIQPRLGCLTLDSQLRGHRAAWKQLQKVLKGEFLDAKMSKYQAQIVGEGFFSTFGTN